MISLLAAIGLAVWAAVAMTFGDWLWAALSLRHRLIYGLTHGTLLCLWLGVYLGIASKRAVRGAAAGAAVGFLAAGSFYAVSPLFGLPAMFASWMLLWLGLAAVAVWLSSGRWALSGWALRGVVAAIGSGAAFYAVSGIWTSRALAANYAWHFAAWIIAFLPGALALLVSSAPGSRRTA